jgi:hypothetical protein
MQAKTRQGRFHFFERIHSMPPAVIEIQGGAFLGCTSLASLDLPEGLQSIGDESFARCESLASLHIPSTVGKIGKFAFDQCEGLRSLTLPETLEIIEDFMFNWCISLTHIEIPPTVTKIGVAAFQYCKGLKHLRIPSSVARIDRSAFQFCKGLKHLRIPSSVTRIERAAFAQCTRLISLELPEGLEMIDLGAEFNIDGRNELWNISGCQSLVNLAIPSEQLHSQLDECRFMAGLKLRHVASNFNDLVIILQHRFDTLPVHRLCYYPSYYPLTETMENLRKSIDEDPSAGTKVDSFGMTPFHILALSQKPNLSLFQALLKVYKMDIIRTRDKFGSTPIDYLCMNHTPDSATVIKSLIVQRIQWLGLA